MKKRLLSVLLAFALLLGLLPLTAITAAAASDLDTALNVSGGNLHFISNDTDNNVPWIVQNDGVRTFAMSGNAGQEGSYSSISMSVAPTKDTSLFFDYKAWGEGQSTAWDACEFYIDSELVFQFGALDNDWTQFIALLPAGAHTLMWVYNKDDTDDPEGDYFAIDNVRVGIDSYPLYIKGQQVNSVNCFDPAGDGKFSYDPIANEFFIIGSASHSQHVVYSEIGGLKVIVTANATLMSMGAYAGLAVTGDTVITSRGGKLSLMSLQGNALLCSGSGRTVTFNNANVYAQGATGGIVSTGSNSLVFTTSSVEAQCENGKVINGWKGGISFNACSVTAPEDSKVSNGSVLNKDNSEPKVVKIQPASVDIHAIIAYDNAGSNDGKWATFNSVNPSSFSVYADAPSAYATAYAYGYVFVIEKEGNFFVAPLSDMSNATYVFNCFDSNYKPLSMTYDYTRNKLFALFSADGYKTLVRIDPITLEYDAIGSLPSNLIAIAADENGVGYGVDTHGTFYSIDLDTASARSIRNNNIDAEYAQDIAYDFDGHCFYWAHCAEDTDGIYRIDKDTGEAALVGRACSGGAELVGMFIVPSAEPASPFTSANAAGVIVTPSAVELTVEDYFVAYATVLPLFATNRNVVWESTDESVATVTPLGVIHAVGAGTATITATSEQGGFTAGCAVTVLPGKGDVLKGFYFEQDPAAEGWTFIDSDGDGYNWQWNMSTTDKFDVYEGTGILISESYVNKVGPLTPDNWAVSPAVTIPADGLATLSLWACGQDTGDYREHFAVYVSESSAPDGTETQVIPETVINYGRTYAQYTADISAFAGKTIRVMIRHFNCTNQFVLDVDAVEVYFNGGASPSVKKGDFDKDGSISVADALAALRIAAKLVAETPEAVQIGDIDGDGHIAVNDALAILRVAAKLADESSLG